MKKSSLFLCPPLFFQFYFSCFLASLNSSVRGSRPATVLPLLFSFSSNLGAILYVHSCTLSHSVLSGTIVVLRRGGRRLSSFPLSFLQKILNVRSAFFPLQRTPVRLGRVCACEREREREGKRD